MGLFLTNRAEFHIGSKCANELGPNIGGGGGGGGGGGFCPHLENIGGGGG